MQFNGQYKDHLVGQLTNLSQSVLERVLYGEVSLCGDAHHEEGLEGHEDVLERVPHVGEEDDEQLVVQVKVESLKQTCRLFGLLFVIIGYYWLLLVIIGCSGQG